MDLFLVICQGAGLAAAAGIRPYLPVLLAGALATADLGIDFGGTDFSFLEASFVLLIVIVVLLMVILLERSGGPERTEDGPLGAALGGIAIGLGALLFAGSLADEGFTWWPGLVGGVVCAALAQYATRSLFVGVRKRLDNDAAAALSLYKDTLSLLLAGLAILAPPASLAALAFFAWLLIGGRRREGEKYAGLRILR